MEDDKKVQLDAFVTELNNRIMNGGTTDCQDYFDGDCASVVLPDDELFEEVAAELCTKQEAEYLQRRVDALELRRKLQVFAGVLSSGETTGVL